MIIRLTRKLQNLQNRAKIEYFVLTTQWKKRIKSKMRIGIQRIQKIHSQMTRLIDRLMQRLMRMVWEEQ